MFCVSSMGKKLRGVFENKEKEKKKVVFDIKYNVKIYWVREIMCKFF